MRRSRVTLNLKTTSYIMHSKNIDGGTMKTTIEGIEVAVDLRNAGTIGLNESAVTTDIGIGHLKDSIDEDLGHEVLTEDETDIIQPVQGHPTVHARRTVDDTDHELKPIPTNTPGIDPLTGEVKSNSSITRVTKQSNSAGYSDCNTIAAS